MSTPKLTPPQVTLLRYCADPINEPSPLLTMGQRGAPTEGTWRALERKGLVVHGAQGNHWPDNRMYLTVAGEQALKEATGITAPPVLCTCWQAKQIGPHRPDGGHYRLEPVEPGDTFGPRHWVKRPGGI